MKVAYMVEVDEKETTYSKQELLDMGLDALTSAYEKNECSFWPNISVFQPNKAINSFPKH